MCAQTTRCSAAACSLALQQGPVTYQQQPYKELWLLGSYSPAGLTRGCQGTAMLLDPDALLDVLDVWLAGGSCPLLCLCCKAGRNLGRTACCASWHNALAPFPISAGMLQDRPWPAVPTILSACCLWTSSCCLAGCQLTAADACRCLAQHGLAAWWLAELSGAGAAPDICLRTVVR